MSSYSEPTPDASMTPAQRLAELLADGPMAVPEIDVEMSNIGIGHNRAYRAFRRMGGKPIRIAMSGPWYWQLPPKGCPTCGRDWPPGPTEDRGRPGRRGTDSGGLQEPEPADTEPERRPESRGDGMTRCSRCETPGWFPAGSYHYACGGRFG